MLFHNPDKCALQTLTKTRNRHVHTPTNNRKHTHAHTLSQTITQTNTKRPNITKTLKIAEKIYGNALAWLSKSSLGIPLEMPPLFSLPYPSRPLPLPWKKTRRKQDFDLNKASVSLAGRRLTITYDE